MQNNFNIIFIADIVGRAGRSFFTEKINYLKEKYDPLFIIANGENSAGGLGITVDIVYKLFQSGVDIITTGSHVWDKKDVEFVLEKESRLLRPLNYTTEVPGSGYAFIEKEGIVLAAVNLEGRTFMKPIDCPFAALEERIDFIRKKTNYIIVDFHAISTAEKKAFGFYFDGRISAVIGSHTHVQTADEEVLPGGTAYITDAGMTGAHYSVMGFEPSQSIYRFLTQIPMKLNSSKNLPKLEGVVVTINKSTGLANGIERFSIKKSYD